MTPGMGGQHEFDIRVITNDPQTPETVLKLLTNFIE